MRIDAGTMSGGVVSKDAGKSTVSKDGFLQILAAQLRYQDPMNVKDNSEYVAQMAQFSSLEQMQNLNGAMTELLLSQKFQEGNMMIGRVAKVAADGEIISGEVTGARLGYGTINILIDGKEYDIDSVLELEGLKKEETPVPEEGQADEESAQDTGGVNEDTPDGGSEQDVL